MKTIEIEYYKKNGVDARKSCEKLKVQKKNQEWNLSLIFIKKFSGIYFNFLTFTEFP